MKIALDPYMFRHVPLLELAWEERARESSAFMLAEMQRRTSRWKHLTV